MNCSSEPGVIAAGAGALPGARRRREAGKRTHGPGPRACLALLAATALLALAAPAQAQTEVWSATLTTVGLGFNLLGCSNGVPSGRCSSTTVLSEDSFAYDSTDYTITGLFTRFAGNLEIIVGADLTTNTLADLTLVVGSTSLVLSGGTASGTRKLIFDSPGVTLTPGTDITVKLTAPGTPNTAAMGAPTITGTAQVGQTLTAVTTGITDADGLTSPTYTYQWIRVDGTEADISGENSSTYTLVDADLGKTIKVRVSFDAAAGNPETLTSAASATVGAATRQAAYASGSDSAALVFARTVQAGEVDRNGISWNAVALALDGGTITQTGATTAARLTHAEQAPLEGHRVDAAPPMQVSASVQGMSLVLVYDEPLDPASMPATVGATTTNPAVSEVSIYGIWVTLTLDAAPAAGATVTLAGAPPASNPVQDEAGLDAPAFSV